MLSFTLGQDLKLLDKAAINDLFYTTSAKMTPGLVTFAVNHEKKEVFVRLSTSYCSWIVYVSCVLNAPLTITINQLPRERFDVRIVTRLPSVADNARLVNKILLFCV